MSSFDWIFQSIPLFYTIHGFISLLVAYIATEFLKRKFLDKKIKIFIFIWTFSFVFPIIGYFMVAWIVYYLLNLEYEPELKYEHMINMDEFLSDFPQIKRLFGESGVDYLLSHDNASETLKLKALTSLSEDAKRDDINMIKKMLGDRNDEVRLYSFSIINKLERNINNKIHAKLKNYQKEKSKQKKIKLASELAHLYWDLVYYQLSDEDLKGFIIKEVEKYSKYVLYNDPSNPDINLLLGKVYLYQKKYNNAQLFISTALKNGINRDFIVPYLAEIFYEKREFSTVKKLLKGTKDIDFNSTLYPIVMLWKDRR